MLSFRLQVSRFKCILSSALHPVTCSLQRIVYTHGSKHPQPGRANSLSLAQKRQERQGISHLRSLAANPLLIAVCSLFLLFFTACSHPTPMPSVTHSPPRPTPSPSRTASSPTIVVDVSNPVPISPLVYGTNVGPWQNLTRRMRAWAQDAGLRLLRFPGGNWGDEYLLTEQQLDDFVAFARDLNAEPLVQVKLFHGTPEDAAYWVRYANLERGYGIRYWNIGNEPDLYATNRGETDYDVDRFNQEWRAFAQAMKGVDPHIQLVGPEISNPYAQDRQGRAWFESFLEANHDLVDIASFHYYPFGKPHATPETLLSQPGQWDNLLNRYALRATRYPLPLAVTEVNSDWTNIQGGDATPDSFLNALWYADVLGHLINHDVFMVAHFALADAGGLGMLTFRGPRPVYHVFRLYQHFGTRRVDVHVPLAGISAYGALRDDRSLTLLVINRTDQNQRVPVTYHGFRPGSVQRVWLLDAHHAAEEIPLVQGMTPRQVMVPARAAMLFLISPKIEGDAMKPTDSTRAPLFTIPEVAWSRPIGQPVKNPPRPRTSYQIVDDGPYQGAPLGGIGAGTIGRTFRGDFARWHLDIGRHRYEPLPANMFSVFMQKGNKRVIQALWTEAPKTFLSAWQWHYPVAAGTYAALYPRSWFLYDWEEFPARLGVEQFSPVLPHNYKESSYPLAVFLWRAENPSDEPVTLGILFTWQNMLGRGWDQDFLGGHVNQARVEPLDRGRMVGVVLHDGREQVSEGWQGSFAIAAREEEGVRVTYRARFRANSDGRDIWEDFAADGALDNVDDSRPSGMGEIIAAGIAVTINLQPGERKEVPIVLAWDLPIAQFGSGDQWYRRYTAFFGTSGRNAWAIAREGLQHYAEWRQAIEDWQRPILEDSTRPAWYKTALFNELYFVPDGATAWVTGPVGTPPDPNKIGHFAQIECYDYPFYETLDVRFYGSFPLLMLWPELEKQVMRDFIPTVLDEDLRKRRIISSGESAPRKVRGAVPHDLGMPSEAPFRLTNAYDWQDANVWKDLNSKFVLLLYRDYVATGDASLVQEGWKAVKAALAYLKAFDRDGDGLPENDGIPDQTFDTWPMKGASAYCGGLWLAALEAAQRMADLVGDTAAREKYASWFQQAQSAYEAQLWNGQYYRYDTGSSYAESIMADQLAGQWYADVCGLPPIVPEEHIRSVLDTVYTHNVLGFQQGTMGAVNGIQPNGMLYTGSHQAEEVWVGVTYALAAFMFHHGQMEHGWRTAEGVYRVTYERGLWFRTPEAWDQEGNFRASMYMRPGAIWAMEWALR